MRIRTLVYIVVMITFWGCTKTHNNSIIGQWQAIRIVAEKKGEFSNSFIVNNYGSGFLNIGLDSVVEFNLSIERDVKAKRNVFGENIEITLIKGFYSAFRKGRVKRNFDTIFFEDHKQQKVFTNIVFSEEFMLTEFLDKDSINWKTYWKLK